MEDLAILTVYFFPFLCAAYLGKQPASIFILNLLAGWTVIGWIIALVWAFKD